MCSCAVRFAAAFAFTGNTGVDNLEGEQLPDRPEPAQIARDRSLKKTNSKYKTRGASDVKNVMVQPPSAASERVYIACEQALLFGRVKRVSRERESERRSREGPRKGEHLSSAPRSRILARLTSLAQIGELSRRLEFLAYYQSRSMTNRRVHCQNTYKQV